MEKVKNNKSLRIIFENFLTVNQIVQQGKQSGWNVPLSPSFLLIQDVETSFGSSFLVVQRFLKSAVKVFDLLEGMMDVQDVRIFDSLLTETDRNGYVVCFPALEAIVDAFEFIVHIQKRLEALKTESTHLALPMTRYCSEELERVKDGRSLWRGEKCSHVSPSRYSREFCGIVADVVREKVSVYPLWMLACYWHPFP